MHAVKSFKGKVMQINIKMKRDIKFSVSVLFSIHHLQAILWLDDPFNECSIEQGSLSINIHRCCHGNFRPAPSNRPFENTPVPRYTVANCAFYKIYIKIKIKKELPAELSNDFLL
jgi:hypothetical protein